MKVYTKIYESQFKYYKTYFEHFLFINYLISFKFKSPNKVSFHIKKAKPKLNQ